VDTLAGSAELADLLAEYAFRSSVPGAAIGVLQDGFVATACYGVADMSTGEPVMPATRFAVGSLGKSMAATAVVRLAEDGVWSLDDPVAARVPELRGVGWAQRASLLDLLANRSGLPMSVESEFADWPDADDAVLSRVAATMAVGDPTPVRWSYSNAGWCVLGRALEVATGLVWEDAMQVHLLDAYGLTETTFTTRPTVVPQVCGHEIAGDGVGPVASWTPRNLGPAGSTLLSTPTDMLRLAAWHLDVPALSRMRATEGNVRIHGWLDGWGLGWARFDWQDGSVWGWDGLLAGQRCVLRIVPQRRGAIVLLTNSGSGRALYRAIFPRLMRSYFGIDMPALTLDPSPGAADDLNRFAGVYAWRDRRWEVTVTDVALAIKGPRATFNALPIDEQTFLIDPDDPDTPTMTFGDFDDYGRPHSLFQMLWAHPRLDC
jgi:CubicO group peptidase (beta-lactamase class C family)